MSMFSTTVLCQCGCGLPAPIMPCSAARRGLVKGQPYGFRLGHRRRTKPTADVVEKFWSYVRQTQGCWLWTGRTTWGGYGQMHIPRSSRQVMAHRFSWELLNGTIRAGYVVCHHCDNPPCVNPAHLFVGTKADNSRDMVVKGRSSRGDRRPGAKLTSKSVAEIKWLLANGSRQRRLAERFHVDPSLISNIATGALWRHIRAEVPSVDV